MAADLTFNAGRLRHRVDIEERIESQDPLTGEIYHDWSIVLAQYSAEIRPISGREYVASASTQSQIVASIVMRFNRRVIAKMRCVHRVKDRATGQIDTVYYNISAVLRDPQAGLEWMTLPCTTGVNHG